jgi:hypothetical protein
VVADTHSSIGQLVIPAWAGALLGGLTGSGLALYTGVPISGAIPGLLACAVLGVFFALCQHRTTVLGYLLVGLFFGINCWILTNILIFFHLDAAWPLGHKGAFNLRSCVLFGEILAVSAILLGSMQSGVSDATLPKD